MNNLKNLFIVAAGASACTVGLLALLIGVVFTMRGDLQLFDLGKSGPFISQSVTASQGGSVQLLDGTRVDIPAGALSSDAQISISEPRTPPSFGGFENTAAIAFREFQVSNAKFLKPVRITLPYGSIDMSDALNPDAVFITRWNGQQWEYLGGNIDSAKKSITIESNSFSIYAVVKLPSLETLDKLLKAWFARAAEGAVKDDDWTNLANQVHSAPTGSWQVLSKKGVKDFQALTDNVPIILGDTAKADSSDLVKVFPKSKRRFLAAALLGHEEAHHVNGDTEVSIRAVLKDTPLATWPILVGKIQVAMANRDYNAFWSAIREYAADYFVGYLQLAERRADLDGVSWASQSSKKWAPQDDGGDTSVQVILTFVTVIDLAPASFLDITHPSPAERAQRIRQQLLKNTDGGVLGKVTFENHPVKGVRLTASNGVWTETDEEGLYLLAPIPAVKQSLTLSQTGCNITKDVPVPNVSKQSLVNVKDFEFDCSQSPVVQVQSPTPTRTPTPLPSPTWTPTSTRLPAPTWTPTGTPLPEPTWTPTSLPPTWTPTELPPTKTFTPRSSNTPQPPPAKVLQVFAAQEWQSAGVSVQPGDKLTVQYLSGLWSPWPGGFYDANGVPVDCANQRTDTQENIVAGVCHASLIGRIGNGIPFYIGNSYSRVVNQSGVVFLHINDTRLGDNSGSITISIRVTR